MDGRIIAQPGSGIATYAAALHRAHRQLTETPLLLKDDSCGSEAPPHTHKERTIRWLKGLMTASVHANFKKISSREAVLHAPDIYRLAQVRFRQTRNMLSVQAPRPKGLIHWSLPVPIRIAGWVNIYTIHDVIPLISPELTPMNGQRHRALLEKIVKTADHIVTVTNYAKQSIINTLGCPPDAVSNCSIAVTPAEPARCHLPEPLFPGRYFIFVGSSERRKNVSRLVSAYKRARTSFPLVLVGPHANYVDPAAGIWNLPFQSAERLSALITNARALVFPSLAEGFGLPIVEAMALGTAVLTSNEGALAEVAEDAAVLADPCDEASIAQRLRMLAHGDDLVRSLEERGRSRATNFSADNFTKKLSQLYQELFSKSTMDHV
ncbi:glycosyltransferase family 1 protein [Sphingobium sp. SA916]|uniref:glycosyltransferase family 4 protein n=1 Tax=Sphingobium sp. SA916 TaxID=1851207 RepID=UPI0015588A02|nr:glycosyltransferase family 1 protein [Sphingobium sp. SA916]